VAEAIAELVEVGVDLPGTPSGQGDQTELGIDGVEELSIGGFIIVSWARANSSAS